MLVSMPFAPMFLPSLGLSLLKAGLAGAPVSVDIRYYTLRFGARVGESTYDAISGNSTSPATDLLTIRELAGEWLFSHAVLDPPEAAVDRYVDEVLVHRTGSRHKDRPVPPALIRRLLKAREQVGAFLDECLDDLLRAAPRLVGFTSVFQQHMASLALARRLRQARPETVIVMGGANLEGVMGAETVRQFDWIDAAVSGEGELVFPRIVRRVMEGADLSGLPGVRTRATVDAEFARGAFPNAPSVRTMDELPMPDYRDYFRQFRRSPFGKTWQPGLLVETSRGCWWGERKHCTFCGLNGSNLTFRSKSADRALAEFQWLARRHPGCDLQVVDNILDLGYFKTLLPELAARHLKFNLFYETKSNLKKEQVRLLRDAGVRRIQPGIESLSDDVLREMNKGVSALQNVQLLKWCREFGVKPFWNLLWGFPGEPPQEYERMARLVPLLAHLAPPTGTFNLRLDRFSPNFDDSERLGFSDVSPMAAYTHIYPLAHEAVANLAYYFRYGYRQPRDPESYVQPLFRALETWEHDAASSALFSVDLETELIVWDLRPMAPRPVTVLRGLDRAAYLACDGIAELGRIAEAVARDGFDATTLALEECLGRRVTEGLALQDGSRYLALAIPLGDYVPSRAVSERFFAVASQLGRRGRAGLAIPLEDAGVRRPSNADLACRSTGVRRKPGRSATLRPAHFELDGRGHLIVR